MQTKTQHHFSQMAQDYSWWTAFVGYSATQANVTRWTRWAGVSITPAHTNGSAVQGIRFSTTDTQQNQPFSFYKLRNWVLLAAPNVFLTETSERLIQSSFHEYMDKLTCVPSTVYLLYCSIMHSAFLLKRSRVSCSHQLRRLPWRSYCLPATSDAARDQRSRRVDRSRERAARAPETDRSRNLIGHNRKHVTL